MQERKRADDTARGFSPLKTTILSVPELEQLARKLRRDVINMIARVNSGHPGGSLSSADIVTALYFRVLKHRSSEPRWAGRDRFVLSKGHAAPILYAALAESGYFPVEELSTLRQLGSRLQGHPDVNLTPGVEMSSGSLGQGLSFGVGAAMAAHMDAANHHTYVLLGDGECQEGQVWEAAMAASQFKLDNLTAIVDHNGQQLDGNCCDIMGVAPLAAKFQSFGWNAIEIDGHSMEEIVRALETHPAPGMPTAIIAHTIKGKGVSFMERNVGFHGKAPSVEETERALKELA